MILWNLYTIMVNLFLRWVTRVFVLCSPQVDTIYVYMLIHSKMTINPLTTNVLIVQKPFSWFAAQIDWFLHDGNIGR